MRYVIHVLVRCARTNIFVPGEVLENISGSLRAPVAKVATAGRNVSDRDQLLLPLERNKMCVTLWMFLGIEQELTILILVEFWGQGLNG
ncbi:hypothetical protein JUM41_25705 [Rhizobium pusense]|uniref:hypothetical protein n=1 Tax=Agrobacterium pusense TaxID=648995 RepID=UPI001FCD5538|nr:hypothetical protein [Agrobacterium pusense]MCJ2877640.1 hypothetical protein [Agrobacterium pusense]